MESLLDQIARGQTLAQVALRVGVAEVTVRRWVHRGVRSPRGGRVRLEVARLPGRSVVTDEALERFLAAVNDRPQRPDPQDVPPPLGPPSPRVAAAMAQLEATGWMRATKPGPR